MPSASHPKPIALATAALMAVVAMVVAISGTALPNTPPRSLAPAPVDVPANTSTGAHPAALAPVKESHGAVQLPGAPNDLPRADVRPSRQLRAHASVVAGRAVDLEGNAVIGVDVYLASEVERTGRTDAGGRFELFTSRGNGLFQLAASSGFSAIASTRAGSPGEALVLATRSSGPLLIEVIDASTGLALEHATARVDLTALFEASESFTPALHPLPFCGSSDSSGSALLDSVPDFPELIATVERVGYTRATISIHPAASRAVQVALEPLSSNSTLSGRVINRAGTPVAGAEVAAIGSTTRSRADGTFTLRLGAPAEDPLSVFAHHPAHGTASQKALEPDGIELTLTARPSEPPRPIRLDSGEALASVRVVPVDSLGQPDPFAPHWYCAQSDAAGTVPLDKETAGGNGLIRVALTKDGTPLGRVELSASGDAWVVVPD